MLGARRCVFALMLWCWVATPVARAGSDANAALLFRWVDKQGVIHLTDRLADVPEPYNGMYRAQLRQRAASAGSTPPLVQAQAPSRGAQQSPSKSPVLGPQFQDPQVLLRQRWQQRLEEARNALQAAINVLQQAQDRLDEVMINPLIRLSPGIQEQLPQLEADRDQAQQRVQQAEKYLQEELPAQARKENIPMRWLL